MPGTAVYSTIGLSRYGLPSVRSNKLIRHELLLATHTGENEEYIPSILKQVGEEAIHNNSALLSGQVIGPRGFLSPGTNVKALFVNSPVFLPDEFATFETDEGSGVIAWLIPVTGSEATFVHKAGWERFEEILDESNPDLFDWRRKGIA
ncbi:suppressor of fused domain protein [Arthrobacter sp. M4]|uniref:suppressor of fused domain protein n=1 Tax=Arthrobacter sp. M4 TaxID=218160 RepID=UPI0027E08CFA|nr:suppressor of fused domain protein [Arthrobacter sp. M4]